MTSRPPQNLDRGNQADYLLGTHEGWGAFSVVRWHAIEETSQPFRYEIILMRPAKSGPVDLDALFDTGATFRIRTLGRWRYVHGILAEVEEIDRTSEVILYRVLLVPHLFRARFRRRCRNFVEWALKDIVHAILENRSPAHPLGHKGLAPQSAKAEPPPVDPDFGSFREPRGLYRWAVTNEERLTDRATSSYVVQYNESDHDFLSRLLEREGLSYYFEHTDSDLVLVVTDAPGQAPLFEEARRFELCGASRGGQAAGQEVVRVCRDTRRMRSRAVVMRDYDWNRSTQLFEASTELHGGDPDAEGHYEFPANDELHGEEPAKFPAKLRLERFVVEKSLREGVSTVRALEPGRQFKLHDRDGLREDVDLLVVRVETFATELTPQGTVLDDEPFGFTGATGALEAGYENRFQALPASIPFRPAQRAPRPRIHGIQTAIVTAEEFSKGDRPEINANAQGCVRVRFPWDQRPDSDRAPSSCWIRVSQHWAGPGFGALYTPRVGHEVLVAYLQGDPERPVIVGRVYNEPNRPPSDPSQYPTRSTIRSRTAVPEGDGYNEIRFEDAATLEEIFLHAQRDFNEVVRASHSTSVGGDQSNSVTGNRTHSVKGTEEVTVQGNRTTHFASNEAHTVDVQRLTTIGADDTHVVFGNRSTEVHTDDSLTISGKRGVFIGANEESQANGHFAWKAMNSYFNLTNDFQTISTTAGFFQKDCFTVDVSGCTLTMKPGEISLRVGGAKILMKGGIVLLDNGAGAWLQLGGGQVNIAAGSVISNSDGITTISAGGDLSLKGANIDAKGGQIKLNE